MTVNRDRLAAIALSVDELKLREKGSIVDVSEAIKFLEKRAFKRAGDKDYELLFGGQPIIIYKSNR